LAKDNEKARENEQNHDGAMETKRMSHKISNDRNVKKDQFGKVLLVTVFHIF
jgi:hypothetical protein